MDTEAHQLVPWRIPQAPKLQHLLLRGRFQMYSVCALMTLDNYDFVSGAVPDKNNPVEHGA
jgi:hypothetical protein